MTTANRLVALLHRHGETTLNANNAFRSRMDPPLNEEGLKQAEGAAEFLGRYDLERIVTSPMLRAYQTACVMQQEFPTIPLIQDRSLMPWDLGFMAGLDRDMFSDILNFYVRNPYKTVPDGEALDQMRQRTKQFFTQEFERDEGLTCYVCHMSTLVTLMELLCLDKEEGVEAGGVLALYHSGLNFEADVLYGDVKHAEHGVT
jgi:broad specificity phosphatase PhoE